MGTKPGPSKLRMLWKRVEHAPWFGFCLGLVLCVALGLGSPRSWVAGIAFGVFLALGAATWNWASEHVEADWPLRVLTSAASVLGIVGGIALGGWVIRGQFDWVQISIGLVVTTLMSMATWKSRRIQRSRPYKGKDQA